MKRMMIAALVTGAAMLPVPALAAPGEITLHIEATGEVAPDMAIVTIELSGRGGSEAEALAQLDKDRSDLLAALGKLGIGKADIEMQPIEQDTTASFVVTVNTTDTPRAAADAAEEAAEAACIAAGAKKCSKQARKRPSVVKQQTLIVTVRKLDALDAVTASGGLESAYARRRNVRYTMSNPGAAREQAVAKAIANARAEAETYARAIGYQVVRIERVSNSKPALNLPDVVALIATIDSAANQPARLGVGSVTVGAAIDFVVAPK